MDIWNRNRDQTIARLDLLDRAAEADPLTEQLRKEAMSIAHKLAGSLGMFGFNDGTRLARSIEHHLETAHPSSATLTNLSAELRQSLFPTEV
jgi:HPt (histidine-containing phosphotransfer) domain-containing protein